MPRVNVARVLKENGVSKSALARQAKKDRSNTKGWFRKDHNFRFSTLVEIAQAVSEIVGRKISVKEFIED